MINWSESQKTNQVVLAPHTLDYGTVGTTESPFA